MEEHKAQPNNSECEEWNGCDKLAKLRCEYPHCTCKARSPVNNQEDDPEFVIGIVGRANNIDVLAEQMANALAGEMVKITERINSNIANLGRKDS